MPRYLVETTVTLTKLYDIEAANELVAVRSAMQQTQLTLYGLSNPVPHFNVSQSGRVEREIRSTTTTGRTTPPAAGPQKEQDTP